MLALSNFRLVPTSLIEIEAFGHFWDLHGSADFLGCNYSVQSQTVKLSWQMSASANDHPEISKYPSEWFDLLFSRVIYFEVSPRDPAMPLEEDALLDTVSFMAASNETIEYLHNFMISAFNPEVNLWDYHILFRFRGGQMIRIGAEESVFLLVNNAPHRDSLEMNFVATRQNFADRCGFVIGCSGSYASIQPEGQLLLATL